MVGDGRGRDLVLLLILVHVRAERRSPESPGAVLMRADEGDKRHECPSSDDDNAPVPWMQQLLDNPFLLLFLGVFVPMMVYTVWGVIDILTLPMAK